MLTLTASAEKAIGRFIKGAESQVAGLRISVTGGGCSGMQYAVALEQAANADDMVIECGAVSIFVDPLSVPMLQGVTVDFLDSMEGSGFKFENPNAATSCGAGSPFPPEAALNHENGPCGIIRKRYRTIFSTRATPVRWTARTRPVTLVRSAAVTRCALP